MLNAKRHISCIFLLSCFLSWATPSWAQQSTVITGQVTEAATGKPLSGADVFVQSSAVGTTTDAKGNFKLPPLPYGNYVLAVFYEGLRYVSVPVEAQAPLIIQNFALEPLEETLQEVVVERRNLSQSGMSRLQAVEGTAIYEAKKSEVILIEGLTANMATNNSRQIFSRVPGLNIWESDGAGLQLGIGGRGLSPNRTSNFNTRQNGYDISADALGYPESYYTPPVEGVEKIQLVRGAASLQYGTQFGGMLNFVMKKGPADKPFEFTSRQTLGSFGLFNSFNSVGGTKGRINYYGFYQHKQGDGWRPNSGFEANTAFADLNMQLTDKFFLCLEYTHMNYLAQQPGGLSDMQFAQDPRQSLRSRNWFKIDWNLMAVLMEYKFSPRTKLEMKNFGLVASRDAMGDLQWIGRDPEPNRTLISDEFRNIGSELRLLQHYNVKGQPAVLLVGARAYKGTTHKEQGVAATGEGPDFDFFRADSLYSDHRFPNWNTALFAENIFNISDRLSITPGFRFEWINTRSEGYYQEIRFARGEGGINYEVTVDTPDNLERGRPVFLAGLGLSYKLPRESELYANFSQNYRSITFSDLRTKVSIKVDEHLKDEKGYSADIGWRGGNKAAGWDLSLFYLSYQDKIGTFYNKDIKKHYRTNIGDAYTAGLEAYLDTELIHFFRPISKWEFRPFINVAYIQGRYFHSLYPGIEGNKVELVPDVNLKSGLLIKNDKFSLSWQMSYLSKQYSDPTNEDKPAASHGFVIGPIPAFYVMDLSASYEIGRHFKLESGVNNLSNNMYFTRRAEGYPGPGIIPSDGRNFYLTLQFKY